MSFDILSGRGIGNEPVALGLARALPGVRERVTLVPRLPRRQVAAEECYRPTAVGVALQLPPLGRGVVLVVAHGHDTLVAVEAFRPLLDVKISAELLCVK